MQNLIKNQNVAMLLKLSLSRWPAGAKTMNNLSYFGRVLILFGIIIAGVGLLLAFVGKVPWLGKLPGDIYIQKKNFTHAPVPPSGTVWGFVHYVIVVSIFQRTIYALSRRSLIWGLELKYGPWTA